MTLKGRMVKVMFSLLDRWRDRGLKTPENIERNDDLLYGKDSRWQRLDVYRTKGADKGLPVIINVHGGGWVYGHKEAYQHYGMALAQKGYAVVNFTYRLAPTHRFPAQLEDLNGVIQWVIANQQTYGLDPNQIFLVGDSAGAHLASLYAGLHTNRQRDRHVSAPVKAITFPEGLTIRGLGLNCGVYDMTKTNHHGLFGFASLIKDLVGETLKETGLSQMDSIHLVTSDFPPTFLSTANGDFLKDQGVAFNHELQVHHVKHEFVIYGSPSNWLFHVFHLDIRSKDAQESMAAMCNFFKILEEGQ